MDAGMDAGEGRPSQRGWWAQSDPREYQPESTPARAPTYALEGRRGRGMAGRGGHDFEGIDPARARRASPRAQASSPECTGQEGTRGRRRRTTMARGREDANPSIFDDDKTLDERELLPRRRSLCTKGLRSSRRRHGPNEG
jgi:hypothetical protein